MRLEDPEEVADDRARERLGQVGHHVHPVGRRHALQQHVDVGLDARTVHLDGARRGGAAHRVAEPRVVRRVAEEHRLPVVAGQLACVRPSPALVAADPPPIPK